MVDKYIAYIRVSSEKQGRSDLGLEAQREIIIHNVGEENIVEWYQEVYTGKNLMHLPKLIEAKERAKSNGYILVMAKTDRLRNTQQALDLVDELTPSGVFFCNVGRNADKFMLTLYFAFAEKERLEISIRTKAALAVLKARGVRLGRPPRKISKEILIERGKLGNQAMFLKSINEPSNLAASNVALVLRQKGFSYKEIAENLNKRALLTPKESKWRASSVFKLLKRYNQYAENNY